MSMVWVVFEKVTNKPVVAWFAKTWAEAWVAKQPRKPNQASRGKADFVMKWMEEPANVPLNPSMDKAGEVKAFWSRWDVEVTKEDKPMSAFNSADWERWEKKRF
jgi:hypothetical protein